MEDWSRGDDERTKIGEKEGGWERLSESEDRNSEGEKEWTQALMSGSVIYI